MPPVALFTATALALALTAGFGLGLWLLLARTFQLPLAGASWLTLVQVHGVIQLFGFVGLFMMGVGLHLLPRLRGASVPRRRWQLLIYALALSGLLIRAVAQPTPALVGREPLLALSALLLVGAAALFAATALRTLASGANPHRADELVIAAGVSILPIAAGLAAIGSIDGWPLVVAPSVEDRAIWLMLLGSAVTTVVGVWARLAPAFVAARPASARVLVAGVALWVGGAVAVSFDQSLGPVLLAVGMIVIVIALGVWGPTIARQPLAGHARLTRLALRSAFAWALAGAGVLVIEQLGLLPGSPFLVDSAARHAFALGFVTLAIYGVAARALPTFLDRPLRDPRLQLAAILLTDGGVALRVVPQALGGADPVTNALVGLSGVLAYAGLVAFAVNLVRSLATPPAAPRHPSGGLAIELRLGTFGPKR